MQRGYCAREEYSGRTVYSGLVMGSLVDDKFPWFVWPLLNAHPSPFPPGIHLTRVCSFQYVNYTVRYPSNKHAITFFELDGERGY